MSSLTVLEEFILIMYRHLTIEVALYITSIIRRPIYAYSIIDPAGVGEVWWSSSSLIRGGSVFYCKVAEFGHIIMFSYGVEDSDFLSRGIFLG